MSRVEVTVPPLEYRLETGVVACRDGFVATFFVPHPHAGIRDFVQASIERYFRLPGLPRQLGVIDRSGWPRLLDYDALQRALAERLGSGQPRADLHIIDSTADASRFSIRYYGLDLEALADRWPNAVSGIRFTFPSDYQGEEGLFEMFHFANDVAAMLPFAFGYLSPGFIFLEGVGEPGAFQVIRSLSRRFLCLDVPALLPDCFEVGDGPKGAFWGTYLSPDLVERLGGESVIRGWFVAYDVRVMSLDGGSTSIYLGPGPIGGDVNRQEGISAYKAEFKLFSKLILPRRVPYMNFDDEAMHDWLSRFSDEGQE